MNTSTSKKSPYRFQEKYLLIEVTLRNSRQLFDSRDPSPFIERDLDDKAREYIVSVTRKFSPHSHFKIIFYFSEELHDQITPQIIEEAVHNYFSYNAELTRKKIRHTLKQGRFALLTGIITLVTCLSLSLWIGKQQSLLFSTILKEGLMILGWVAMWRPMDVFLYSWWPQIEDRRILRKLANAPVETVVQKALD